MEIERERSVNEMKGNCEKLIDRNLWRQEKENEGEAKGNIERVDKDGDRRLTDRDREEEKA